MDSANCFELLYAGTDMLYFYTGKKKRRLKKQQKTSSCVFLTEAKAAYV